MIVVFVVYLSVVENVFVWLNFVIIGGVGWWYILVVIGFVVFVLYCGIFWIGIIWLGCDDEFFEFSFWVWLVMLFSVGMGIGLVFYGVVELFSYYLWLLWLCGVFVFIDVVVN